MKRKAYRIVQSKFAPAAFDGEGAWLFGGRWNSVGTRIIYAAGSLSLGTLELLVHLEDIAAIYGNYTVIPIEFDASLVQTLPIKSLPRGWNAPMINPKTQMLGDQWIREASSALLEVPSAVIESETNFLLNPAHADFAKIEIGKRYCFKPDPRLAPKIK